MSVYLVKGWPGDMDCSYIVVVADSQHEAEKLALASASDKWNHPPVKTVYPTEVVEVDEELDEELEEDE